MRAFEGRLRLKSELRNEEKRRQMRKRIQNEFKEDEKSKKSKKSKKDKSSCKYTDSSSSSSSSSSESSSTSSSEEDKNSKKLKRNDPDIQKEAGTEKTRETAKKPQIANRIGRLPPDATPEKETVKVLTCKQSCRKIGKIPRKTARSYAEKNWHNKKKIARSKIETKGCRRKKSHSATVGLELESLLVTLKTPPQILNLKPEAEGLSRKERNVQHNFLNTK